MRKRSKYRPREVLVNPMAYMLETFRPVAQQDSYLLDLKIKNHGAMTALTQGHATRADIDTLIAMNNIVEALWRMGFGKEYEDVLTAGHAALLNIANRGAPTDHFIARGTEMTALNAMMELHDAQMEIITVGDMERAIAFARREFAAKRTTRLITQGLSA